MAAGIFLSRLMGLARSRVFAHYFGTSDAADAFNAAFRIPNFLQNLFGEGVLSASFIPVYARLLAERDDQQARDTAASIAVLLSTVTSVLVLAGVLLTPWLIDIIAPGFDGAKRALTMRLVRILFPGAGLLVLSAWCLGVLNSHGRFFLSYSAPILWNLAIIGTLMWYGAGRGQFELASLVAWGAVLGSLLQLAVQLPAVLRVVHWGRARLAMRAPSVQTVIRNFGPVFVGRGVVQISAYVDTVLASLLPTGAVAGLAYAQLIYTLPVSLFGMSVSAAELPAMSRAAGDAEERASYLRLRLGAGLRKIAFYVVPSAVAFLVLGDVISGALYQTGEFDRARTVYVWGILAGSALGLVASTLGRLYASTSYALHDTRTPLRIGLIRVALTVVLGYLFAIPLPIYLGIDARWGAAGLTASAGIAGWIEFLLLRRAVNRRIGRTGIPLGITTRFWIAASGAAAVGWAGKSLFPSAHPILLAVVVLGLYGAVYVVAGTLLGMPEARRFVARLIPDRG